MLSIKNSAYNYTFTLLETHSALRKLAMINVIQAKIIKQTSTVYKEWQGQILTLYAINILNIR